jgi:hypothetical protein
LSEAQRRLQGEGGRKRLDEAGRKEILLDPARLFEMTGIGGTQGGKAFGGIVAFPSLKIERSDRFALLEEETPHCLATPEKAAFPFRHQGPAIESGERRSRRVGGFVRLEDPDPSSVLAVDESVLLLEVAGNRRVILDDLAVEIDDSDAPRGMCVRLSLKPFAFDGN